MTDTPAVATILVIFAIIEERLQVLLVHRDEPPEAELWALPGGLWDGGRTLQQAAEVKLFEETGARDVYLEQLFTESGLDPTQQGVAIAYFALVEAEAVRLRESADDAWRPAWLPVDALPPLAFSNGRVIAQAVERVRAKLDYTNIAYGLLPERFTLRELQAAYEAILGAASRPPQLPQAHALDRRDRGHRGRAPRGRPPPRAPLPLHPPRARLPVGATPSPLAGEGWGEGVRCPIARGSLVELDEADDPQPAPLPDDLAVEQDLAGLRGVLGHSVVARGGGWKRAR